MTEYEIAQIALGLYMTASFDRPGSYGKCVKAVKEAHTILAENQKTAAETLKEAKLEAIKAFKEMLESSRSSEDALLFLKAYEDNVDPKP